MERCDEYFYNFSLRLHQILPQFNEGTTRLVLLNENTDALELKVNNLNAALQEIYRELKEIKANITRT